MADKIVKWNDKILTFNDKLVRTYVSPIPTSYPTRGLVARYAFEDNYTDSYGSNNGWSVNRGSTTYVTGKVDKALTSTSVILYNTSNTTLVNLHGGTTVNSFSAWTKLAVTQTYGGGCAMVNYNTGSGSNFSISCYADGASTAAWKVAATGQTSLKSTNHNNYSFNDNAWHHIVYVYNGTTWYLYIDNVLWDSASRGSITTVGRLSMPGNFATGDLTQNYTGLIDQVYFYTVDLTTDEIAQLWNNGNGI
jgi:hypothetical protein